MLRQCVKSFLSGKMDDSDRQEAEFLLDTYLSALGMIERPMGSVQAAE